MIEQAKFTYSHLGIAFEKQIKTTEDQGEKQLKAIQDKGQVETIKKYTYDVEDTPFISKQKETFNELVDINKIQNSEISLADVKNNQEKFKSYLGEIKKANKKHRSKEQKNTLYNIKMLYKARTEATKFYNDYSLMMPETKAKATKGTGTKTLTPKQMLQRLPIVLTQLKAGNNSESLLNEIRQIVYSLYQSKQITKKVYNNIIKFLNTIFMDTMLWILYL